MQAGRTKTRSSENNIGKESTVHLIPIDLPRTFPHLSFFHPEGPLYSQLRLLPLYLILFYLFY